MAWKLKQRNASGDCVCGGNCGETADCNSTTPTIDAVTCVSKSAPSFVRVVGWAKFDNWDSGDWNNLRFKEVACTGDLYSHTYQWSNGVCGQPGSICTQCQQSFRHFYGSATVTPLTSRPYYTVTSYATEEYTDTTPTHYLKDRTDVVGHGWPGGDCPGWTDIYTDLTHQVTGSWSPDCDGYNCLDGGSAIATKSDPDTVADALARVSHSTGTSCKTTAGGGTRSSVPSRHHLGTTVIPAGARSVTVTFDISNIVDTCAYQLNVAINRYTAGGGSYVDTIYDTVDFTAANTTANIDYEVPVNTDYDYEYSSATIAAV